MIPFLGNYLDQLKKGLDQLDLEILNKIVDTLIQAKEEGKQIFVIGNGGSASAASHLACDLSKNTIENFKKEEKRFRVIGLTDNMSVFSAYANDCGYEAVFEEPLKNLMNPGDRIIAISASGNSPNILRALKYAKFKGGITIGLAGFSGGKMKEQCDFCMIFPEAHYGRSEDAHLIIGHMIREAIMEKRKSYLETHNPKELRSH